MSDKVGIGTTSPAENLTIEKTVTSGDGATALLGVFAKGGASGEDSEIYLGHSATRAAKIVAHKKGSGNDHDLSFSTNASAATPTEKMRIDSSGRVGIGTTSPESTLEITGASANSNNGATVLVTDSASLAADIGGTIALRGTDGTDERTYGLIKAGKLNSTSGAFDGYLSLQTRTNGQANTTEAIRIDSSQNVGIGTASPADRLHVALDSSTTDAEVEVMRIEASSSGTPAVGFGPFILVVLIVMGD